MAIGWDESSPGDTSQIPAFPGNERAFRAAMKAGFGVEHDDVNGRHKLGIGSQASRDAITNWVNGSAWILQSGAYSFLHVLIAGIWTTIRPPLTYAERDKIGDWTLPQESVVTAVSPAAGTPMTLAVTASIPCARKATLSAATKLSNPTGFTPGSSTTVTYEISQNGTGGWALTFDTDYIFIGGAAPAIGLAASSKSMLWLTSTDNGKWLVNCAPDIK